MPRPRIRAGLLVVAVLPALALYLAGCSSQQAAGWTFTPTQPVSAPPSAASSASAAGSATGSPSASGSGQQASGATLNVAAQNIAFNPTTLDVPAGKAFTIHFNNQDSGVPHNIAIFQGQGTSGTQVFKGDLVTGPAQKDYSVPALQAGTYTFICEVHPNMTGSITVK